MPQELFNFSSEKEFFERTIQFTQVKRVRIVPSDSKSLRDGNKFYVEYSQYPTGFTATHSLIEWYKYIPSNGANNLFTLEQAQGVANEIIKNKGFVNKSAPRFKEIAVLEETKKEVLLTEIKNGALEDIGTVAEYEHSVKYPKDNNTIEVKG